jgi:hypothetical protein
MESRGVKSKELLTILGPVSYSRSMFRCPVCGETRYPGDEALDVVGTTRSPGLRRLMARAGSQSTFVGAIETAEQFGWRIYKEAVRRGMFNA